jgi:hypothetical protein
MKQGGVSRDTEVELLRHRQLLCIKTKYIKGGHPMKRVAAFDFYRITRVGSA